MSPLFGWRKEGRRPAQWCAGAQDLLPVIFSLAACLIVGSWGVVCVVLRTGGSGAPRLYLVILGGPCSAWSNFGPCVCWTPVPALECSFWPLCEHFYDNCSSFSRLVSLWYCTSTFPFLFSPLLGGWGWRPGGDLSHLKGSLADSKFFGLIDLGFATCCLFPF